MFSKCYAQLSSFFAFFRLSLLFFPSPTSLIFAHFSSQLFLPIFLPSSSLLSLLSSLFLSSFFSLFSSCHSYFSLSLSSSFSSLLSSTLLFLSTSFPSSLLSLLPSPSPLLFKHSISHSFHRTSLVFSKVRTITDRFPRLYPKNILYSTFLFFLIFLMGRCFAI